MRHFEYYMETDILFHEHPIPLSEEEPDPDKFWEIVSANARWEYTQEDCDDMHRERCTHVYYLKEDWNGHKVGAAVILWDNGLSPAAYYVENID